MLLSRLGRQSGVTMQQLQGVTTPSLPEQTSTPDLVVLDDQTLSQVAGGIYVGPGGSWSDLNAGPGNSWSDLNAGPGNSW
jgi:hypothetical protein